MSGMTGQSAEQGEKLPPQPLEKCDRITWEGLEVINAVMGFGNLLHRNFLDEDKQRIREQLQNIVDHIEAFIPIKQRT